MFECHHIKVYANLVLLSYPAQFKWICYKCLEEGIDREDLILTYEQLKERKERIAKQSTNE